MFVLDTNVLIYYASGDERVVEFVESNLKDYEKIAIPTICIVEFLSYPKILATEKDKFLFLIKKFEVLPLDYNSALAAASLRLAYKLKVVDSVVAAASLVQNAILVSRDKDFKRIKEIEVIDL